MGAVGLAVAQKSPTWAPDAAVAEGGVAVGERLPNLQKCELSLFHSTELFNFAKEQVETIRTRLREELRPSPVVTIKTGRRRYIYII